MGMLESFWTFYMGLKASGKEDEAKELHGYLMSLWDFDRVLGVWAGTRPEAEEPPPKRQERDVIPSCASQCVMAHRPCENRDLETQRCFECRYSGFGKKKTA